MSALPSALPLALSASLYPPALLVLVLLLTGDHPRRLVLAYFIGAALMVVSAGLAALAVINTSGATSQDSSTASGWVDIAFGIGLLVLAAWAWRRWTQMPDPDVPQDPAEAGSGRIARLSARATESQRWAFVLGLAMFLPSPMYLLGVKDIAESGDSTSSNVLAVLICAVAVMLFVEIPLIAMFIRPDGVAAAVGRFHNWLTRNGWRLTAIVAALAGIYAIIEGIGALT
ncbi:MAG: GAP family protein [Solirubrobacteraceae bacterium]